MELFPRMLYALFAATLLMSGPAHARYVSLGYVELPSHEVTAALVQQVLERLGYNVGTKKGAAAMIYPRVAAGDLDLFVAATLPEADKAEWAEFGDELIKVAKLYDGAGDKVYLIGNKGLRSKLDKYAYFVLSKMELSLRAVREMEAMMAAEKMSARDAARQWLGSHPNTLRYWMEPEER